MTAIVTKSRSLDQERSPDVPRQKSMCLLLGGQESLFCKGKLLPAPRAPPAPTHPIFPSSCPPSSFKVLDIQGKNSFSIFTWLNHWIKRSYSVKKFYPKWAVLREGSMSLLGSACQEPECLPPLMNIVWELAGIKPLSMWSSMTLYGPKFIHSNSVSN